MNTPDISRARVGAAPGPLSPAPIYPLAFRSTSLNLRAYQRPPRIIGMPRS